MGYVGKGTTTAGKRGGSDCTALEMQESMPRMPQEFLEKLRAEPGQKRWTELVMPMLEGGTGRGELSSGKQWTNPDDKKHLLLRSGEVKWCWRCGAPFERNSAPRLLLKTACSGAPRTKEYERALSLLGKRLHPKSSVLKGRPTPVSDEEWEQWHESHGSLFFCLRQLSCS